MSIPGHTDGRTAGTARVTLYVPPQYFYNCAGQNAYYRSLPVLIHN